MLIPAFAISSDFDLRINDKKVDIQGLEDFRFSFEAPIDDRLDQVKKLVAQLHSSLNVTDHQVSEGWVIVIQLNRALTGSPAMEFHLL